MLGGEISVLGALINAGAVLLGGGIGLLCKGKIPAAFSDNIIRAIGLCVCIIGAAGAIKGDLMLLVVSLALGAIIGELLRIDAGLNQIGLWVQKSFSRKDENSTFAEGFVSATLLFCVGAMAIIGSIESGLGNGYSIIITKSTLDGLCAMFLASALGAGVLFSAAAILLYQGSIEMFAGHLQGVLSEELITQISATGCVMIFAIGLNLVLDAKIKVANLLPGLAVAVGYYYVFC